MVDAWNNRHQARYQLAAGEARACNNTKESSDDYMGWYYHFGHPHVINTDPEAQPYIQKATSQRKSVDETKEKKGLFGLTWKKYISCRY
ncbi:hypothetical protein MKX03_024657, partial [Papaver bracteatum]